MDHNHSNNGTILQIDPRNHPGYYAFTAKRSPVDIIILTIVLAWVQLFAMFGNSIVIACVCNAPQLRTAPGNVLIINLAITDIISSLVVMPSSIYSVVTDGWQLGQIACNLVCSTNYAAMAATILTLCFIAMDRYIAVTHALRYHQLMSRSLAMALAACTWLQGICFGIPPSVFPWVQYDYWELTCSIQWHVPETQIYVGIAFVVSFLLPAMALCTFYIKVMHVAAKKYKARVLRHQSVVAFASSNHPQTNAMSNSQPSISILPTQEPTAKRMFPLSTRPRYNPVNFECSSYTSSEVSGGRRQTLMSVNNKGTRSMFVLVFVFFICLTPFAATKLYKNIKQSEESLPPYVNYVASILQYCSSAVNPLIYGIFRKDYRLAFAMLLKRMKLYNPDRDSSGTTESRIG